MDSIRMLIFSQERVKNAKVHLIQVQLGVKHNPNKLYVRQPDFRNTEDQPYPTSVADAGFCGGGGGARGLAPLSVHLCLRQGFKYLD